MKLCKKCFENKPEVDFYKRKSGTLDGLYSYCIPCTKQNQKEYRQTEVYKKGNTVRVRRWQQKHKKKHGILNRKSQRCFAKKMTNSYIIKRIKGRYNTLNSEQIKQYPELIEATRMNLKIKRLL
jgi:hypothetical protein